MQAERWGSDLLTEDVEHVDLSKRPFTVRTSDTEVLSQLWLMSGCQSAHLHRMPILTNRIAHLLFVSVR